MSPRATKLFTAWIVLSFTWLLVDAYVSNLPRGLWEDGYFAIRFAHQAWAHGMFAWNVGDGPVYGMTSQTLQLLGAALYAIDASHVVTLLRAALTASVLVTLFTIGGVLKRYGAFPLGLLPAAAALSLPLLLELIVSGLETAVALCVVAIAIYLTLELFEGRRGPLPVALTHLLVYWTRPDAVLIPLVLLGLLGLQSKRRAIVAGGLVAAGLAASLTLFYFYYGTALPLPFYIKTHGISVQTQAHLAVFAPEKTKNAIQAAFWVLPFIYIALHDVSRRTLALLASGLALAGYHYLATVETMGHHSRFYMPALVPLWIAGALAYPAYLERRRTALTLGLCVAYVACFYVLNRIDARQRIDIWLSPSRYLPYLAACCVVLLVPRLKPWLGAAVLGTSFLAAAALLYPIGSPQLETDRAILLRQIAPRRVFRGLARLQERVHIRALFHTDMGAPGLLFPEARVVDLDGLLNEDITLHGARFDALCIQDRPEAIFVPNESYPELRHDVLTSECFKNYRAVDDDPSSPLRIRADLHARYLDQ